MSVNSNIKASIEADPAIDWKALDRESEEFKAYYIQRQREGFYRSMQAALRVLPDEKHLRYWSSLDKDRQEAIINEAMDNHYMNPSADLDDIEVVGDQIFKLVYMMIHVMLTRKKKASQVLQKAAGSKYHKAPNDNLLRKAIHNYQNKTFWVAQGDCA